MPNTVDLLSFIDISYKSKTINSTISSVFVDFSKYENQGPKSQRNSTQSVVDLWIFDTYSSNSCLSLETFITQVDEDLWIFEIQYINTIKSINKFHYQDFDVTIVNSI